MAKFIMENSVSVEILHNHNNPSNSIVFYNPVMKINRELVLACVGAYCTARKLETTCLDAFAATGLSGLLWKKHVTFPITLTINDYDPVCVEKIKENCKRNGFTVMKELENPIKSHGDGQNEVPSKDCPIEVSQQDANVLMHQRQFNFIHVDPFGSSVQNMDAMFRNVYHGGMIVITSTDIAALCGKCPQVTLRNYNAYTVRTDYTKEMAVRILLAQAARSAAKCNKGFDVMYSVALEHFVTVGLKIKRGANHGNSGMSQISRYLHCLHCQEWGQLPNTHTPIDNPYSHLPCKCKAEQPGQTAVVLGPMWHGEIFSFSFIKEMRIKAAEYKLSARSVDLLTTMMHEAECKDFINKHIGIEGKVTSETDQQNKANQEIDSKQNVTSQESESKENTANQESDSKENTTNPASDSEVSCNITHVSNRDCDDNIKNNPSLSSVSKTMNEVVGSPTAESEKSSEKRKLSPDESNENSESKKQKTTVRSYGDKQMPLFYYNLHRRRVKDVDIPKIPQLLEELHKEGFRASVTSFDNQSVRTNACVEELKDVLLNHFKKKEDRNIVKLNI